MPVETWQDKRRAQGLCIKCGKRAPIEGKSACIECRDKGKRYYQEVQKAKTKLLREERYSKDQCVQCAQPLDDSTSNRLCYKCHISYLNSHSKHMNKDGTRERRRMLENARTAADRETYNAAQRAKNRQLKHEVFTYYGGSCACCEESILEFLTIDHVKGDGGKMRREGTHPKGGVELYRWIKRQGYPAYFQVLCYNCNCAKRIGDKCPHQVMRELVEQSEGALCV